MLYLGDAHGIEDGEIAAVIGKVAHIAGVSIIGDEVVGAGEFTLAWGGRRRWRYLRVIDGGTKYTGREFSSEGW